MKRKIRLLKYETSEYYLDTTTFTCPYNHCRFVNMMFVDNPEPVLKANINGFRERLFKLVCENCNGECLK